MSDGGNSTLLHELFTADAARHFPSREMRLEDSPAGGPSNCTAFRTVIHQLFGEGDLVAARITHHVTVRPGARCVTQMGAFEAGGKNISGDAAVVFRFHRISEEWVNRNELSILRQLKAVGSTAST